jgi:hypothetical protein
VYASLIAEAVVAINVLITQFLGVPSQPPIGVVDQSSTTLGGRGVSVAQPLYSGVGSAFSYLFGVGGWGSLPLSSGFCFHRGRSPWCIGVLPSFYLVCLGGTNGLLGSSKGGDPEGGVVYPRVVQDSRSCFRTMGVCFRGLRRVFWIS